MYRTSLLRQQLEKDLRIKYVSCVESRLLTQEKWPILKTTYGTVQSLDEKGVNKQLPVMVLGRFACIDVLVYWPPFSVQISHTTLLLLSELGHSTEVQKCVLAGMGHLNWMVITDWWAQWICIYCYMELCELSEPRLPHENVHWAWRTHTITSCINQMSGHVTSTTPTSVKVKCQCRYALLK